jgi:hypothetical protein
VIWTVIEWAATATSFAGTFLIARHAHQGWLLCCLADAGFVVFACEKKLWGFLTLCLGYTAINFYGWTQ